jgi:hypothetical protein
LKKEEKKIHQVKPFKSEVLNHPSHENELTSIIKINTPEVQSEKEKEISATTTVSKNEFIKIPVSGFSLSSIALKKEAKEKNKPTIKVSELPQNPFKQKDLELLWKQYIETLKKDGKSNMASILFMNSPILSDNFQISFKVANEMNKSELIKEMEKLMPYLRNHLNNQILSISIGISENIKEETIFSSPEKYQHLLKINPVLDTLRKTFYLDF